MGSAKGIRPPQLAGIFSGSNENSYSGVPRVTYFFLALIAIAVVALISAFVFAAFTL